jgi:hypothetical protein
MLKQRLLVMPLSAFTARQTDVRMATTIHLQEVNMSRSIGRAPFVLAGLLSLVLASVGSGQPAPGMAGEAPAQAEPPAQPGTAVQPGRIGSEDPSAHAAYGSTSAGESRLQVRTQNGVEYVSGGVSHEEEDAINSMGKRFNLKLTLAQTNGEYMGGAQVRIDNSQDHSVVETQSDGPLFFAKLTPGTYTVHVSGEGEHFTKVVQIKGTEQQQLSFVWPGQARREGEDAPR